MSQAFSRPDCFSFTDLIQVHTITVEDEVVCLQGYYMDPITGMLTYSYFETEFDVLYDLLGNHDFDDDALKLIDELSMVITEPEPKTIELKNELSFMGILFRLSALAELDEEEEEEYRNGEHADKPIKISGFYIEDWMLLEDGMVSFEEYVSRPKLSKSQIGKKKNIELSTKKISGYLCILNMRYIYYKKLCAKGEPKEKALYYSSLLDQTVFKMAVLAHKINKDIWDWS
jgi:hypothetical protein